MDRTKPRFTPVLALLIILTAWYGLTFIGVPGLVGSWSASNGLWFYLAAALGIGLLVGGYALWTGRAWGNWQLSILLGLWLYLQYTSHWRPFFFPPSAERIQGYYASFPYWYLIPKSSDRVVPDGFHTIMHMLMVVLFAIVLARVMRQIKWRDKLH